MKTSFLSILSISIMTVLSGACTTADKKNDSSDVVMADSGNVADVVVQQAGSERPVVSPVSRQYFVDARKNLPGGEAKLFATLGTGSADTAEAEARSFLVKSPNNRSALIVLSSALVLQRKYPLAGFYAEQLERLEPGNPDALNIRGLASLYTARNSFLDYRRSAALFQKSFNASGSQIAAGLNLAHLQLEMGQAQAASDTFKQVTNRNRTCTQAWLGYGIAKTRMGDFKEATVALESILDRQKDHPEALYYLALVKKNGYNDNKQASSILRRILAGNSSSKAIRQKSQSLLRLMEGEGTQTEIARDHQEDSQIIMTNSAKRSGENEE